MIDEVAQPQRLPVAGKIARNATKDDYGALRDRGREGPVRRCEGLGV